MRPSTYLAVLALSAPGTAHATGMLAGVVLAPSRAPDLVASASLVPHEPTTEPLSQIPGVHLDVTGVGADLSSALGGDPLLTAADPDPPAEAAHAAPQPPACADAFDNDGDGLTDFPDDPGCITPGSVTEQPRCQDGLDTDEDGGIDFDGGASMNGGVPLGAPDPQCAGAPWRYFERP